MAEILVVDDHPQIVRLLQRLLEAQSYEVSTAADGEEALRKVYQEHPRLIVLDVAMPKKNGLEVLRELKSDPATREIVVIMLTGKDQDGEMTLGLQSGADWYLPKPFRPEEIVTLARRFLRDAPS